MLTNRTERTTLALLTLLLVSLALAVLSGSMSPAHADPDPAETDGGNGQGVEGGDGCDLYGWGVVDNAYQIPWQDSGYGGRCGNSAYANRNTWTSASYTHNWEGSSETHNFGRSQAPLYKALNQVGAGACAKRHDILAVWYVQDSGVPGIKSWVNYGATSTTPTDNLDRPRHRDALRDAIDNSHLPGIDYTPDVTLTDDWWWGKIQDSISADEWADYQEAIALGATSRAQLIDGKIKQLKGTVSDADVTSTNPVVFCWFRNMDNRVCKDRLDWNLFVNISGVGDSRDTANCFVTCPTNARAHAGEPVPVAVLAPNDGRNDGQKMNDYCWPPDTFSLTEYGWTSTLWGLGALRDGGTVGGSAPYGWTTTLDDRTPAYPGMLPWGTVPAKFKISSFGHFWNTYCAESQATTGCMGDPNNPTAGSCDNFANAYANAVNATRNTDSHATVDLDDAHKETFAQGRVIEVRELETWAAAYCNLRVDEYWTRTCSGTNYYLWSGALDLSRSTNSCGIPQNPGTGPNNPGSWSRDYSQPDRPYSFNTIEALNAVRMPRLTGAFQLVTNHCNDRDFNDTITATSYRNNNEFAGSISTGDDSKYYSASAISRVVPGNNLINGTDRLPWGVGSGNKTANASFYNRVCAFDGKLSNPNTHQAFAPEGQRYMEWTFFRDGMWHNFKNSDPNLGAEAEVGYFTPDQSTLDPNVVRYENDSATQTVVTRDPFGSPKTGEFNLRAVGEDEGSNSLFNEDDSEAPALINFQQSDFVSKTVGMVSGEYSKLETKQIWASDRNKPQVLTVRWRFSPTFFIHSATSNIGWGGAGGSGSWSRGRMATEVDGMTWSKNRTLESKVSSAMRQKQWSSSGSDSANTLDVPLPDGFSKRDDVASEEWDFDPTSFSDYYYTIFSVRAVSE